MLPIFSGVCVIKKCEYLPSAEYPAVIITTPAMNLPRPSVTPEAVRNSVSMFSFITGARAGISFFSSGSVAARQRVREAAIGVVAIQKNNDEMTRVRIKIPLGTLCLLDGRERNETIEYNSRNEC